VPQPASAARSAVWRLRAAAPLAEQAAAARWAVALEPPELAAPDEAAVLVLAGRVVAAALALLAAARRAVGLHRPSVAGSEARAA
jgi:hypothetical protein